MGVPFKPNLKAHELPRETLVDLWHRTMHAHEKLCEMWFATVTQKCGPDVADAVAVVPQNVVRRRDASRDDRERDPAGRARTLACIADGSTCAT